MLTAFRSSVFFSLFRYASYLHEEMNKIEEMLALILASDLSDPLKPWLSPYLLPLKITISLMMLHLYEVL